MAGNPRKPTGPVRGQITRPGAPAPARPQAAQRPSSQELMNRSANLNRMSSIATKREAIRDRADQNTDRPRPMVRPAAPPQRVMPAQPVTPRPGIARPATAQPAQAIPRPTAPARPAAPPARQPTAPVRPVASPPTTAQVKSALQRVRTAPPPPPPARYTSGALALNTAAANAQIATEVAALQSSLADLESRVTFNEIYQRVVSLDKALDNMLSLLEGARSKGYVYQADLDNGAYQVLDQWQSKRDRALEATQQQSGNFQNRLSPLVSQVQNLNRVLANPPAALPLIGSAKTQASSLLSEINQSQSNIVSTVSDAESETRRITSRLTNIHWALTQLGEATFKLGDGEDLVMAVAARWDQEGDTDPEGILYLTNKRLIFERKEKVATKKVLFISVAKELVQEVMIDQDFGAVQSVKPVNKGLFGHQDFIEVQFTDKKLGVVPFHLNGQDSKEWASLIGRAKSGEMDQDRSTGSKLSYADLTGELTSGDLMALQKEVNDLQEKAMLKSLRAELASVENDMRSLERKLSQVRSRGYVIEKSLEADIAVLAMQWDRIRANADKTLESQANLLSDQMKSIQGQIPHVLGMASNLPAARPQFIQVKSAIASLGSQVEAAEMTVIAQFDEYSGEVEALTAHLEWIAWMLEALETASFKLLATESGVAATEATYARPGMEPENGVAFLTDQRLIWEDRVGDFEVKVETPGSQIQDVKKEVDAETGQEALIFTFAAGASLPSARLDLALPVADSWLKMVNRVRTGGYAQDRAVEISPEEMDRIRNAPQQCSNCGASFTAPILRGQTEIACEYCSVITRV